MVKHIQRRDFGPPPHAVRSGRRLHSFSAQETEGGGGYEGDSGEREGNQVGGDDLTGKHDSAEKKMKGKEQQQQR